MIVVVDSGIWISAIEFGGTPAIAIEKVLQAGGLAISLEIEEEVFRVLQDKFGRNPQMLQRRLGPPERWTEFTATQRMTAWWNAQ